MNGNKIYLKRLLKDYRKTIIKRHDMRVENNETSSDIVKELIDQFNHTNDITVKKMKILEIHAIIRVLNKNKKLNFSIKTLQL